MRSGVLFAVPYYAWNHYAITIDVNGAGTAGTVKLYINGEQRDSYSRGIHVKCDAIFPLDHWSTGSQLMTGYASELRVWGQARSAANVLAAMHRRLTRAERFVVLAYYNMDGSDDYENNMVADRSSSAALSFMGGYRNANDNSRFVDPDFHQAGWAPVCEYYE